MISDNLNLPLFPLTLTTCWYVTDFPAFTRNIRVNIAPWRRLLPSRVTAVVFRVPELLIYIRWSFMFLWMISRPVLAWFTGKCSVHRTIVPTPFSNIAVCCNTISFMIYLGCQEIMTTLSHQDLHYKKKIINKITEERHAFPDNILSKSIISYTGNVNANLLLNKTFLCL